ncbi:MULTISPECIES: hypothetical protein [Streptomyces]|uniref:hypothetical protein n=1 Tax=Streptomyces TaxID=1883 RepID=UPI001D0AB555|nr:MULTISPECIES: hypothetical protein [Streptomyces]MCX5080909.1 hypothetical protein [Streptomyces sp. NBC_00401]UDL99120.1 hypothetical protein LGI35_13010 [Streptomyces longhuiensis]
MTHTLASAPRTAPGSAPRTDRLRRVLRAVAVVSCLPYLAIKAAWIAGSHLGIPDGSSLLDHRASMIVANSLSLLLDSAVIVLALLLTRPWGRRVPAWLLVFPMWVATGLLTPIMTGYPLQLLVRAFGGSVNRGGSKGEPFLDEWVFGVVYSGFILQGLTLGTLFALYARDRWGHTWRGPVRELTPPPADAARRALALSAALLALFPLTLHALWACGATTGLNSARIADRSSDFYVLEATDVAFLAAAALGVLSLAFRRGGGLPVKLPLTLAWLGSGAVACWGGWLALASLTAVDDITRRPTPVMNLTYAVQMIVGILAVAVGVRFLADRAERRTAS